MAPRQALHVVHNHSRWRRTLAAEKAAVSRNNPDSVAYRGDDDEPPKVPVTLPRLRFMDMKLSFE
jgi:hypothetical protein